MSKFIVLDGADGSGTTTQQCTINDYLTLRGLKVYTTKNPSKGEYGLQLRKYLGNLVLKKCNEIAFQRAIFGLFLADRKEMQEREIRPHLVRCDQVLCDRWSYSTLVYQPLNSGITFEEILRAHESDGILIPDLSLIFVGDPNILMKRVRNRGNNLEVFENLAIQKKVDQGYRDLSDKLRDHNLVYINAEHSVEGVFLQIQSEIDKLYGWRDEMRIVAQ